MRRRLQRNLLMLSQYPNLRGRESELCIWNGGRKGGGHLLGMLHRCDHGIQNHTNRVAEWVGKRIRIQVIEN